MELRINSRKLRCTFTYFCRPGGYIFCDMGNPRRHGQLGNQICRNGQTRGNTLSYGGETDDGFRAICQNWHRQYVRQADEVIDETDAIAVYEAQFAS